MYRGATHASFLSRLCIAGPSGPGGGTISDDHVKELIHINKSLSALGNCIDALTRPSVGGREVRVPFRDSMLTVSWLRGAER